MPPRAPKPTPLLPLPYGPIALISGLGVLLAVGSCGRPKTPPDGGGGGGGGGGMLSAQEKQAVSNRILTAAKQPTTRPRAGANARRVLATTQPLTLYDRLGGRPGVERIVDGFVARALDDPKANLTRRGHPAEWQPTPENVLVLKKRLDAFIACTTGGPVDYRGPDLETAFRGAEITDDEFAAMAADLTEAMRGSHVQEPEQLELLAVLDAARPKVVATPATKPAEAPTGSDETAVD